MGLHIEPIVLPIQFLELPNRFEIPNSNLKDLSLPYLTNLEIVYNNLNLGPPRSKLYPATKDPMKVGETYVELFTSSILQPGPLRVGFHINRVHQSLLQPRRRETRRLGWMVFRTYNTATSVQKRIMVGLEERTIPCILRISLNYVLS